MSGQCSTCGGFLYGAAVHRCPPRWMVWCPEDGDSADDARTVYAPTPAAAAESWAESDDPGSDYRLLQDGSVEVHVATETGSTYRFKVTGESVPSYDAEPVT